jgi:hypothetical protein
VPGEEGSGSSTAALRRSSRRHERQTLAQQSHTSLHALGVSMNTPSQGERCVVGVVVAYACLLLLSGARARGGGCAKKERERERRRHGHAAGDAPARAERHWRRRAAARACARAAPRRAAAMHAADARRALPARRRDRGARAHARARP